MHIAENGKKALYIATILVVTLGIAFFTPQERSFVNTEPPTQEIHTPSTTIEENEVAAPDATDNVPSPEPTEHSPESTTAPPSTHEESEDPAPDGPEAAKEDTSEPEPVLPPDFSAINEETRSALVNVLCTVSNSGSSQILTGSGVIIHPAGIILTNAHIAQFLLLGEDQGTGPVSCTLRTGSPAKPAYTLELAYISPSWIAENADQITANEPTGTGEYDFAFLRITGTTSRDEAPDAYPYVPPAPAAPQLGEQVLVAGYSAGFLSGTTIQRDLFASSAVVYINQIFTFDASTTDLISLGGSIVAQKGASGGAVVSGEQELLGIIVTSTDAETTQERVLRAITLQHINATLSAETDIELAEFLAGNVEQFAQEFRRSVAPALSLLLVSELAE